MKSFFCLINIYYIGGFMVYLFKDKLTIQNYSKIIKIDKDEIVFIKNKNTYIVNGDDLTISYYDSDEFTIKGKVNHIIINED